MKETTGNGPRRVSNIKIAKSAFTDVVIYVYIYISTNGHSFKPTVASFEANIQDRKSPHIETMFG
jgi:hypothetical protein